MTEPDIKWTIMAYINADNILANFAVETLKQLRNAASKNVRVIAEFDDNQPDKNQQHVARFYRFDGTKNDAPIDESLVPKEEIERLKHIAPLKHIRNVDMTRPETLTEFIDFATHISPSEHYCLILWGHGIELLLDADRRFGGRKLARRYLTTVELGKALQKTKLVNGELGPDHPKTKQESKTLDIIGIDACSMSMIEVASAVQDYADYMIASQEDVPDVSFPYENILKKLKSNHVGDKPREVCKLIPQLYKEAFRDYIATPNTGVKGITLASLDLRQTRSVTTPLQKLSAALLAASYDAKTRKLILKARKITKDFVFGLLVDIADFCTCVDEAFKDRRVKELHEACDNLRKALERGDEGFVIENQVADGDKGCHGVSVYLPYRDETDATDNTEERFSKGGDPHPLKGGDPHPLKERTVRIRELEADFSRLKQFRPTGWMEFIKRGWSFIVASQARFHLDYYYSAEQAAQNLRSLAWIPKGAKVRKLPRPAVPKRIGHAA